MRPLTWVDQQRRWLLGASAALVLALALPIGPASIAQAQGACRFMLGFATLATMIGTGPLGECREDQRSVANGNAEQLTSKGLLVWRKADNWTAFTNGYQTWINGPYGLAQRLNTERFPWESEAPSGPFASYAKEWWHHGFTLNVQPDGQATARWRVYTWCAPGVPQPCDGVANNEIQPGGRATLTFRPPGSPDTQVVTGTVTSTTDPKSLPVGPVRLALLLYDMGRMTDPRGTTLDLCGPNFAQRAPAAFVESSPCGA